MVDLRLQAELRKRGGRVAAAHDGESGRAGDRFGDDARAGREGLQLEGAHGAVPERRARTLDLARVARGACRPDVKAEPTRRHLDAVEDTMLGVGRKAP